MFELFSEKKTIEDFVAPFPYKQKYAKEWITMSLKQWGKESYRFIVELKSTKKPIGIIGVFGTGKIDGTAKTYSAIDIIHRNNSYATEAKIILLDFAFTKMNLHRLESEVIAPNKASNSFQRAFGYKLEGTKRKAHEMTISKKLVDMNIYGLLKSEWKKIAPKLKKDLKKKIKELNK
jgi:RimJ/RimL family protein N-acetyltransferase